MHRAPLRAVLACGGIPVPVPALLGEKAMSSDPSWVYWLAGIAAGIALVYLIIVLFNAEFLD